MSLKPAALRGLVLVGCLTIVNTKIKAIKIKALVPKNGNLQEAFPNTPPTSGPPAIPKPIAASYNPTAFFTSPDNAISSVIAVAKKNELPSPHPARKMES